MSGINVNATRLLHAPRMSKAYIRPLFCGSLPLTLPSSPAGGQNFMIDVDAASEENEAILAYLVRRRLVPQG